MPTIVAEKEFVVIGTEHAQRFARFATSRQFLKARIVSLRDCHTPETMSRKVSSMSRSKLIDWWRQYILSEIHNLESLCAQDCDLCFQEDQVIRIRGQREILSSNDV